MERWKIHDIYIFCFLYLASLQHSHNTRPKDPYQHHGLWGLMLAETNKHNKAYRSTQSSLNRRCLPLAIYLEMSSLCSFLSYSEDVGWGNLHLNAFPGTSVGLSVLWLLTRCYLSTAEASSNSLINTALSGRLNCLAAWESARWFNDKRSEENEDRESTALPFCPCSLPSTCSTCSFFGAVAPTLAEKILILSFLVSMWAQQDR